MKRMVLGIAAMFLFAAVPLASGQTAQNDEAEVGERPPTEPTAPLRAYIDRRYSSTAHKVFTNCPLANQLAEGILVCEFRLIQHQRVLKGTATVEAEGDDIRQSAWWLIGFHSQAPAPLKWRRCRPRPKPISAGQVPAHLLGHGVNCQEAAELATRIGFEVEATLRLPRRFTEGEYGTNTLGHLTRFYHCRGKVRVRQGSPNPYGRERAMCRTRFGDRLIYTFDQHS